MTPGPTHRVLPACSPTVRLIRLKKLVIAISRVIAPSCSSLKWATAASQMSSVTPGAPSCGRVAASVRARAAKTQHVRHQPDGPDG